MTPVIRLLVKARDHIAGPGMFWQNQFYKNYLRGCDDVLDGPCCPLGAIGFAADCHPNSGKRGNTQRGAELELAKSLSSLRLGRQRSRLPVIHYSDTPGRTQPEIVTLFNDTIKRLEATP